MQFLQLYGPIDGVQSEGLLQIAKNMRRDSSLGASATLSEKEQIEFAKIGSIYRLNAFANDQDDRVVLNKVTSMSHSCIPNCY